MLSRADPLSLRLLLWAATCCTLLTGALVVLPFYAYAIPIEGAGSRDDFDVKRFWPFAFEGAGSLIHAVTMGLAGAAPLTLGAAMLGGAVIFLSGETPRKTALLTVVLSVFVGVAYALRGRAILSWHFD